MIDIMFIFCTIYYLQTALQIFSVFSFIMDDMLVIILFFFGGAMSWTMALGQLMDRKKTEFTYMLAAFLFCAGVCMIYNGLGFSGLLFKYPHFAFTIIPFFYFTGPSFFFCFKYLTGSHFHLQRKNLIHLVPLAIITLALVPLYALDAESKIAILSGQAETIHNPGIRSMMSYYKVIMLIVVLAVLSYLAVFIKNSTFLLNIRYLKLKKISSLYLIIMGLTYCLALTFVIGFALYGLHLVEAWFFILMLKINSVLSFLIIFLMYLASKRDPHFFQFVQHQAEKMRYERSKINKLDIEDVLARMDYLMTEEKMFFEEDLNLNRLAGELAIEPYQLSQILNEKLGKNFNMYINEFRIDEAKNILIREPDRSIISVSYAVGFNSPTSFYDWFLKMTGSSPSKYRKKEIGKHIE